MVKPVKQICLQSKSFFAFFAANTCKQFCLQDCLQVQTTVLQIVKCCLQYFRKENYVFADNVTYLLFYIKGFFIPLPKLLIINTFHTINHYLHHKNETFITIRPYF